MITRLAFISILHCAIYTRYWYPLNLMEKTQCLQQTVMKNVNDVDRKTTVVYFNQLSGAERT